MIVVSGSTVVVVVVVIDVVIDVDMLLLSSEFESQPSRRFVSFVTRHNIVFERKEHRNCAIEKTHIASQHNSHTP